MANAQNAHRVDLFTNRSVCAGCHGITVGKNHNISRGGRRRRKTNRRRRRRKTNRRRRQRGGRKKRKTRRRQRGGGYGFDPNGPPNKGFNHKAVSTCGVKSDSSLGVGKQYAPLLQKGGGVQRNGLSYGGGGVPFYEFSSKDADLAKDLRGGYAPIQRRIRPQCGGRKKRRKNRRSRRRNQRGGYHQYRSNLPDTPGLRTPNGGSYRTANPPTFSVINSCVDNYNHYKGGGSPSPVLDQDYK